MLLQCLYWAVPLESLLRGDAGVCSMYLVVPARLWSRARSAGPDPRFFFLLSLMVDVVVFVCLEPVATKVVLHNWSL